MYWKQQTSDHQQFRATPWQLLLEMHSSFSTNWFELQSIATKECNPNVLWSFYPKQKQHTHKKTRYSFLCSYVYLFVWLRLRFGFILHISLLKDIFWPLLWFTFVRFRDFIIYWEHTLWMFLNIIMSHFLTYPFHNWRQDNSCRKVRKHIYSTRMETSNILGWCIVFY